ncbi:MAG: hypothetical protein ACRC2H_06985, partial [Silanimonas sp.]
MREDYRAEPTFAQRSRGLNRRRRYGSIKRTPECASIPPTDRIAMSSNRLVPTTALIGLALAATACAGVSPMQPVYAKAAIRDLDVRTETDQLSLRYKYPPETAYFSGGVNVERKEDLIRVVIARCKV